MVSVAYMDPGNYSTAVLAGANYKYRLLFLILLSNCLAVFLQILSARLGCVTGLDLAANCKKHLPARVNMAVYIMAEMAIIATDLAEVVGTAIALNILFNLPLVAGVIVTIVDVLVVLMAYRPNGPMLFIRVFEGFVSLLVTGTVVCFAVELYQVSQDSTIHFDIGDVFKGFLPSDDVVESGDDGNGLYLSLAILGATVMPHSLYLGSGLVQSRLKEYDEKHGHLPAQMAVEVQPLLESVLEHDVVLELAPTVLELAPYVPSIHAINETMAYTITELVISLFTVALFVNSAILIVAGATLDSGSETDLEDDYEDADLYTIYDLLTKHLSATAGMVFALALLFSGQSAGIVCTLAGQMVLEGFLNWSFPPVIRRLVTRSLAILPCFVVVLTSGREGLSSVLNMSQVVLSLMLPVVTAPLIMFTSSKRIMRVESGLYAPSSAAIMLQDLRNHHPCSGFEEEEEYEQERLLETGNKRWREAPQPGLERAISSNIDRDTTLGSRDTTLELLPLPLPLLQPLLPLALQPQAFAPVTEPAEFKDMSNGPLTTFLAVLVWGFITVLNLFLIWSTIFD